MLAQSVLLMAAQAPVSNGGLCVDKLSQIFFAVPP